MRFFLRDVIIDEKMMKLGFAFRILGEPALANPFPLVEYFQNAPETREGSHSQDGAPEYARSKAGPYSETDSGNQERPPDLYTEPVFTLNNKRMKNSNYQERYGSYEYSVPVHIVQI